MDGSWKFEVTFRLLHIIKKEKNEWKSVMIERISLEPEAITVCVENAVPPLIFQLPPWQGRQRLEEAQSTPIHMYPAKIQKLAVNAGKWGTVRVYVVSPMVIPKVSNVIFYMHGAGWVFGRFL